MLIGRAGIGAAALAVLSLMSGCGSPQASSHSIVLRAGRTTPLQSTFGPLWLVTGPDRVGAEAGLMRVNRRGAREILTFAPNTGTGVSDVSANRSQVLVTANADSEHTSRVFYLDKRELRLTVHGYAATGRISPSGVVAYVILNYKNGNPLKPYFVLKIKDNVNPTAKSTIVYKAANLMDFYWVSSTELGVIDTRQSGSIVRYFSIAGTPRLVRMLKTVPGGSVISGSGDMVAVIGIHGTVVINMKSGKTANVPTGWFSVCWPNNSTLLVTHQGRVGELSMKSFPHFKVGYLGSLPKGKVVYSGSCG